MVQEVSREKILWATTSQHLKMVKAMWVQRANTRRFSHRHPDILPLDMLRYRAMTIEPRRFHILARAEKWSKLLVVRLLSCLASWQIQACRIMIYIRVHRIPRSFRISKVVVGLMPRSRIQWSRIQWSKASRQVKSQKGSDLRVSLKASCLDASSGMKLFAACALA